MGAVQSIMRRQEWFGSRIRQRAMRRGEEAVLLQVRDMRHCQWLLRPAACRPARLDPHRHRIRQISSISCAESPQPWSFGSLLVPVTTSAALSRTSITWDALPHHPLPCRKKAQSSRLRRTCVSAALVVSFVHQGFYPLLSAFLEISETR